MSTNDEQRAETMTRDEALELLADGHRIISIQAGVGICTTLQIGTADLLPILSWESAQEAMDRYGVFTKDQPGSGVGLLRLGYALCEALDIDPPGRGFTGKGFQARANAQAIREHLEKKGDN